MFNLPDATPEQNAIIDAAIDAVYTGSNEVPALTDHVIALVNSLNQPTLTPFVERLRAVREDKDRVLLVMADMEAYCNYNTSNR